MERYVAFIEIIGLPVLVERPGDRLARILRELEDPLATLGDARIGEIPARFLVNSYRATTFAHGVAISTDASQLGLALLLSLCAQLSERLRGHGLHIRSAAARGAMAHTTHIATGPALLQARALAATAVIDALILLSDRVDADVHAFASGGSPFANIRRLDCDGRRHLHLSTA
jgi:hypothetical protein